MSVCLYCRSVMVCESCALRLFSSFYPFLVFSGAAQAETSKEGQPGVCEDSAAERFKHCTGRAFSISHSYSPLQVLLHHFLTLRITS